VRFKIENDRFAFLSPLWGGGGLGATYDVHLWLIGKRVEDFLLVLIELFSLGVTAEVLCEYRLKISVFAPTGSV